MPTFDYPKNQIHPAQTHVMKYLVDKIDAKKIIEVGSWVGESTSYWANAVKEKDGAKVYAVDWFEGNPGTALTEAAKEGSIYHIFKNNMRELGLNEIIQVFYMSSRDASSFIDDGFADIVYIDACHDYPSVKQDIDLWLPKVRHGGIICGHDCEDTTWDERYIHQDVFDGKHHGVIKAVHETFPAYNIIERIWWLYKYDN